MLPVGGPHLLLLFSCCLQKVVAVSVPVSVAVPLLVPVAVPVLVAVAVM